MGKGLLPNIKGVFFKKIERFYCKNVYLFCFLSQERLLFTAKGKPFPWETRQFLVQGRIYSIKRRGVY